MKSRISINFYTVLASAVFVAGVVYSLLTSTSPELLFRMIVLYIAFITFQKGTRQKFYLNPYYLFLPVPVSLLIYSEAISPYYLNRLNSQTWIIAILNMTVFLLFLGLMDTGRADSPLETLLDLIQDPDRKKYNEYIPDAVILLLLGKLPWMIRMFTGKATPLDSILPFCTYASIFCAMKSRNKWCIIIISLINAMFLVSSGFNKTSLLFMGITYCVCYEQYYVTSRRKMRKMLLYLIAGGLLFLFVVFPLRDHLRGGGSVMSFFTRSSKSQSEYYLGRIHWTADSRLMMPYMYLVTPWTNLQHVMETQNTRTYGLWTLKPLLGYLQLDDRFKPFYSMSAYSSFNTFTYIAVQFKDFGLVGSVLGSAILGSFVGCIYKKKLLNSGSPFDNVCYAITAVAVFEMFFSNHFFKESYPFTIVIIMWIYTTVRSFLPHKDL